MTLTFHCIRLIDPQFWFRFHLFCNAVFKLCVFLPLESGLLPHYRSPSVARPASEREQRHDLWVIR